MSDPRSPRHLGRCTNCVTGFRWITTAPTGAREQCRCQHCQHYRSHRYNAGTIIGESTSNGGP